MCVVNKPRNTEGTRLVTEDITNLLPTAKLIKMDITVDES